MSRQLCTIAHKPIGTIDIISYLLQVHKYILLLFATFYMTQTSWYDTAIIKNILVTFVEKPKIKHAEIWEYKSIQTLHIWGFLPGAMSIYTPQEITVPDGIVMAWKTIIKASVVKEQNKRKVSCLSHETSAHQGDEIPRRLAAEVCNYGLHSTQLQGYVQCKGPLENRFLGDTWQHS